MDGKNRLRKILLKKIPPTVSNTLNGWSNAGIKKASTVDKSGCEECSCAVINTIAHMTHLVPHMRNPHSFSALLYEIELHSINCGGFTYNSSTISPLNVSQGKNMMNGIMSILNHERVSPSEFRYKDDYFAWPKRPKVAQRYHIATPPLSTGVPPPAFSVPPHFNPPHPASFTAPPPLKGAPPPLPPTSPPQ